jgi:hypothetical protein
MHHQPLSPQLLPILLLLALSPLIGLGQSIDGRVLDMDTKQPLENVNVYVENSEIGAATNTKGVFKLRNLPAIQPSDSLTFSRIGYKTVKIAFLELTEKPITVLMQELPSELSEVTIEGKNKLNEKLSFHKLSPLKKGVFAFGSIVVNDSIYVIGGSESFSEDAMRKAMYDATLKYPYGASWNQILNELEPNGTHTAYNNILLTYDIQMDEWRTTETHFENREQHQIHKFEEKVFVLGGKRVSNNGKNEYLLNTIEIFDLDSSNIIVDDVNPHQAVDFASFTYKDNILVMGGSVKLDKAGKKVFTDKCRFFNITSGYWYELENMTKAKEVDGALIGDKVYLIGGFDGQALTEIESLDLSTGKWEKEGDLFYAMENPSITSHGDIIYIYNFGKLTVFNTLENTLSAYDIDLYLKDPNLLYHKNKLYVLGGYTEELYSKTPSPGLFAIDLDEMARTKVRHSKELN